MNDRANALAVLALLGFGAVVVLRRSSRARGVVEDVADAAAAALGVEMVSAHFSLAELCTTSQRDSNDEDGDGNRTERKPNVPNAEELENLRYLCVAVLEPIRSVCGDRSIRVSSGFRSDSVNEGAGGSSTSDHPKGLAADIYVDGLTHEEVATILYEKGDGIPFDQIIVERHTGHLHVGAGPKVRGQFLQTSDGKTYSAWVPAAVNS